jgi:hypothetical protein
LFFIFYSCEFGRAIFEFIFHSEVQSLTASSEVPPLLRQPFFKRFLTWIAADSARDDGSSSSSSLSATLCSVDVMEHLHRMKPSAFHFLLSRAVTREQLASLVSLIVKWVQVRPRADIHETKQVDIIAIEMSTNGIPLGFVCTCS